MDASKSRNAVKNRDDSSSRDKSIIMDVIRSRTNRIDSREDSNILQGTSNNSRNSQLEHEATAAETIGKS
jgi:hypothetical protein